VSKTGRFVLKKRVIEATELHLNKAGTALEHNHKARLCNHYCYGKTTSISYFECLSVALDIQHAVRMRDIVVCGLSGYTIFFHIISWKVQFSRKILLDIKFVFFYNFCLKYFSF